VTNAFNILFYLFYCRIYFIMYYNRNVFEESKKIITQGNPKVNPYLPTNMINCLIR